jgi:hypothetical protein
MWHGNTRKETTVVVEVLIANGEGLDALLEINDEQGLVRAKAPSDGVAAFWLDRGREYRTWLDEGERTASNLLGVVAWRVNHNHYYRILQGPDGSLVPDDQFDRVYEELLAEHGPAEYERILRKDRGI